MQTVLSHDDQGSMAAGLCDRPGRRHLLRSLADILAGWTARMHERRRLSEHPAKAQGARAAGRGQSAKRPG